MKHIALALATATTMHAPAHHKRLRTWATPRHRGVYLYVRERVVRRLGARAAGRDIVRDGTRRGRKSTDRAVVRSTHVLERMLHPSRTTTSAGVPVATVDAPATTTTGDGMEQCVISHESGGDPSAVNGQYSGIGQWSATQWAADGGDRYGSSPLDASYSEQEQILASEGDAGMEQQQGQYDGC